MKEKQMKIKNYGNKLTFLSDGEVKEILRKYDYIIKAECKRRSYIPGKDHEDLAQECRIKIIAGAHLFDTKRSEKNWVIGIIRKTLDTISKTSTRSNRAFTIENEKNETIPVYNYSFETFSPGTLNHEKNKECLFEEYYFPENNSLPMFASRISLPDEGIEIEKILDLIQRTLPSQIMEYIKSKMDLDTEEQEIVELFSQFTEELKNEKFSKIKKPKEYKYTRIRKNSSREEEGFLNILATFFVEKIGISKENLKKREITTFSTRKGFI